MNYEKSCGGIVFYKIKNNYEILILNFLYGKNSMWGFPKGHMENNETEIETALREIKEESGLNVTIFPEFRETTKFIYKENTILEVVYFSAQADNKSIFPQKDFQHEKVVDYKWLDHKKALDYLSFECDKNILKKFCDFYKISE